MEEFHCPRCNQAIITEEDGENVCAHVAFHWLSLINDFTHTDAMVDVLLEELQEQDEEDIVEALVEKLGDKIEHHVWSDSSADSCGVHEVVVHLGIWKDNYEE